MYMNIYITPTNEVKLKTYRRSGESMSGLINRLLENHFQDIDTSPINTPPTPKKNEEKIISEAAPQEVFRTPENVLAEITAINQELETSVNQDPDYWAEMNAKKQNLWDEYHRIK